MTSRLIIPPSARRRDERFFTLLRRQDRVLDMIERHDFLRRHRTAESWERDAHPMIAFGFAYGDQLVSMATRLRTGKLLSDREHAGNRTNG